MLITSQHRSQRLLDAYLLVNELSQVIHVESQSSLITLDNSPKENPGRISRRKPAMGPSHSGAGEAGMLEAVITWALIIHSDCALLSDRLPRATLSWHRQMKTSGQHGAIL